jgi:plasmid maintenance system antidote protein VapI
MSQKIPFPHPGETIREDFLGPLGMSVNSWLWNSASPPPE